MEQAKDEASEKESVVLDISPCRSWDASSCRSGAWSDAGERLHAAADAAIVAGQPAEGVADEAGKAVQGPATDAGLSSKRQRKKAAARKNAAEDTLAKASARRENLAERERLISELQRLDSERDPEIFERARRSSRE